MVREKGAWEINRVEEEEEGRKAERDPGHNKCKQVNVYSFAVILEE